MKGTKMSGEKKRFLTDDQLGAIQSLVKAQVEEISKQSPPLRQGCSEAVKLNVFECIAAEDLSELTTHAEFVSSALKESDIHVDRKQVIEDLHGSLEALNDDELAAYLDKVMQVSQKRRLDSTLKESSNTTSSQQGLLDSSRLYNNENGSSKLNATKVDISVSPYTVVTPTAAAAVPMTNKAHTKTRTSRSKSAGALPSTTTAHLDSYISHPINKKISASPDIYSTHNSTSVNEYISHNNMSSHHNKNKKSIVTKHSIPHTSLSNTPPYTAYPSTATTTTTTTHTIASLLKGNDKLKRPIAISTTTPYTNLPTHHIASTTNPMEIRQNDSNNIHGDDVLEPELIRVSSMYPTQSTSLSTSPSYMNSSLLSRGRQATPPLKTSKIHKPITNTTIGNTANSLRHNKPMNSSTSGRIINIENMFQHTTPEYSHMRYQNTSPLTSSSLYQHTLTGSGQNTPMNLSLLNTSYVHNYHQGNKGNSSPVVLLPSPRMFVETSQTDTEGSYSSTSFSPTKNSSLDTHDNHGTNNTDVMTKKWIKPKKMYHTSPNDQTTLPTTHKLSFTTQYSVQKATVSKPKKKVSHSGGNLDKSVMSKDKKRRQQQHHHSHEEYHNISITNDEGGVGGGGVMIDKDNIVILSCDHSVDTSSSAHNDSGSSRSAHSQSSQETGLFSGSSSAFESLQQPPPSLSSITPRKVHLTPS